MRFSGILLFFLSCCAHAMDKSPYSDLIQQSLNQQSLCLGEKQWPVSIRAGTDVWINAKMEALVDAGLIISHMEAGQKIWELTPYGQALFKKHHDFCYGTLRVRAIKTISSDKEGITYVTFTYYIQGLPEWAKNHSVRIANTDLDNLVMGVDTVRYQALFSSNSQGVIHLISEPEQLDLLY